MSNKIVVGPFGRGFKNDIPPFYVDNDSFPLLINAYQWRARVKRKRGTTPICRLQRFFNSALLSYGSTSSFNLSAGAGNLLSGFGLNNVGNIPANTGNIIPGTVQFTDSTAANTYTDLSVDGMLQGAPAGSGTINYATGAITIVGGAGHTINAATFSYYPSLPVMDIEDLNLTSVQFPQTLSFDTTYSYQIVTASPYFSYDVSFYKNPAAAADPLPGYVPKTNPTAVVWNGKDYQQFWSVNYENAIWATNGVTQPFTTTNIGMQFKVITTVDNITGGPPALADLTIDSHGLVVGDFVFINEVLTTTGINLQTGYVTVVVSANKVTVEFPNAKIATNGSGGIAQYLTSSAAFPTKDCLRWYDGAPTSGSQFSPSFVQGAGWVNFCPPIYDNPSNITIEDLPSNIYYLVGSRMIFPYKDRLLFLGPVIQSSSTGPFYLQDSIIFSQNGTPYYTCSFDGSKAGAEVSGATAFNPILTPTNQSATANAYFTDVTGYGGYITAGISQQIATVGANQDVLIVGFTNRQTKVLYTGNDLFPFSFYIINSELGSTATFSGIVLDRGVIAIGDRGITITDQQSCSRIDLDILDYVFEFDLLNNGTQRITAQRDFVNEWIYFTFPYGNEENVSSPFPNQTLFYNYRDNSWAVFNESYTTYGPFRRQTGFTWQTVGGYFLSWNAWNQPWNASSSSLEQPEVIAGNQQGFVVARSSASTSEAPSLSIQAINISTLVVTSPNHGLNTGDFVFFLNAIGMSNFNSLPTASPPSYIIWQITVLTVNTFSIVPQFPATAPPVTGTYSGNGTITRLYIPQIMSKQFPTAWGMSRKTRLGVQQYLFSTTTNAQVTLQIYLSQNSSQPFNNPPYVPDPNAENSSVVYSNIVYTCQESTNLGLTPANQNFQQLLPVNSQAQTWHRMNTSLIGDTVQVGITLSSAQMFDPTLTYQIAEIELHGMILDVSPSQVLA